MTNPIWIWQYDQWPQFCWNDSSLIGPLARVREKQGRLVGMMDALGFENQSASPWQAPPQLTITATGLCRC